MLLQLFPLLKMFQDIRKRIKQITSVNVQTALFIILSLVFTEMPVGSEKLFHNRDHSDIQLPHLHQADSIVSDEDAQQYVKKYGFQEPVDWEAQEYENAPQPEHEDPAPTDISKIISEGLSLQVSRESTTESTRKSSFVNALKLFQQTNGLPVTGILDDLTKEAMEQPRCGVPDKIKDFTDNDFSDGILIKNYSSGPGKNQTASSVDASHARRKHFLSRLIEHTRSKRENLDILGRTNGAVFTKKTLRWRLMGEGYSIQLSIEQQRYILRMAFRIWSEVTPLLFEEDLTGATDTDIKLGFGTGRHLGCSQFFDGTGQEFAHAWFLGDIHFDDDEHFVGLNNDEGISLLKVAVHEIGHVLGLPHVYRTGSVMQPNYIPQVTETELDWLDRKAIQELYGVCEGAFSTVFDWVRKDRISSGDIVYRFNTYFFRANWYWMYENRRNRTRYGDPILISTGWRGIPSSDIDGCVHIWTWNKDAQYFFKGTQYWQYNPDNDRADTEDQQGKRFPRLITDGFPGVPSPIDTAFYDRRDHNIYFFKGNNVTAFNVDQNQKVNGYPKRIIDVFPPVIPHDHPVGNLDTVYFSYTYQSVFFFKDKYSWKLVMDQSNPSLPYNSLLPRKNIADTWFDICDVHPSMLSLPSS
ncbi:matrix metalloproteinase-21-like [Protopterus annectens]|uniref:matrix metalloproteinase-21-like n=1 Tax=Protopterus annectens TaxID=7888 RepID=UPI001CF9B4B4|nr:matrix metalloproteinase-21-like [Protopterus annectens]